MTLFQPPAVAKIAFKMLYEAERLALEHREAAAHHQALADMYAGRAERLKSQVPSTATTKEIAK